MPIENEFRKPTAMERNLFNHLLDTQFEGKTEIAKQLDNCEVRTIDEEGSLELRPSDANGLAPVEKTIPIEAEGIDEDGVCIHWLLHVRKGIVTELEVYKDDGSPIKRMPHLGALKIIVLPA